MMQKATDIGAKRPVTLMQIAPSRLASAHAMQVPIASVQPTRNSCKLPRLLVMCARPCEVPIALVRIVSEIDANCSVSSCHVRTPTQSANRQ